MARINDNYLRLKSGYLFSEIARRVKEFQGAHPDAKLIRLGIGDATQPLPPAIVAALHAAVDEMARAETFRGYGPETGYEFLTELIAKYDYGARGVTIAPDEIFVSDGSKSDAANFQELFSPDAVVALTDPVLTVYLDSNVMAGRAGGQGLSVLSEQPDGRRPRPGRAQALGGLGARRGRRAALRRRVRGLHPGSRRPAFDLRGRGRAPGRGRVPLVLEDRGLHRHALRLHGGAEGSHRALRERRDRPAARALVPAPVHEVQRRAVRDPARRGRRLYARRRQAGARDHRLLHGKRAADPRRAGGGGAHGLRRPQRAVHLGEDAGRFRLMGLLRQAAGRGARGGHARRRL